MYFPGAMVNLHCNATLGDPPRNIHWCYKRNGLDQSFIEYPIQSDVRHGNVTQEDCQYSQTSVLMYKTTGQWSSVTFMCETEWNSTCGLPGSPNVEYVLSICKFKYSTVLQILIIEKFILS